MKKYQISISLSDKFKEAVKAALALTLSYGIALTFSLDNPYWAAFSVAMLAIAPRGQSLRKGMMRLIGTIPGAVAGIFIFVIAAQNRWLFISLASLWMIFTTFMMVTDTRRSYMWNVAGFVCLIILISNSSSSYNIFESASNRIIETGLGIIIYTLITVFIWPKTNIRSVKNLATSLLKTQQEIFNLSNKESIDNIKMSHLHNTEMRLLESIKELNYSGTYEAHDSSAYWTYYYDLSYKLMTKLNNLHKTLKALPNDVTISEFENLNAYAKFTNANFKNITLALDKKNCNFIVNTFELRNENISAFPYNNHHILTLAYKELSSINEILLTLQIFISDTTENKRIKLDNKRIKHQDSNVFLKHFYDRENINSSLFVGLVTFIGFIIWIYLDPPGHAAWLELPAVLSMMIGRIPQTKMNQMFLPLSIALSLCFIIYTYIMPHFSNFASLGCIFFLCMFSIMYFTTGINQIVSILAFIMIPVTNQQHYDAAFQINTSIFTMSGFVLVYILSYIMNSSRPQKRLQNLLHRYFNSSLIMINPQKIKLNRSRLSLYNYHYHEVDTLPKKISHWAQAIDHNHYPNNSHYDIINFTTNLQFLSYSILSLNYSMNSFEHLPKEAKNITSSLNDNIITLLKQINTIPTSSYTATKYNDIYSRLKYNYELLKYYNSTRGIDELNKLIHSYFNIIFSLDSYHDAAVNIDWNHWNEEVFA